VNLRQPHGLPYPNDNEPNCPGAVSRGVVLGVEFVTDIALFSLSLSAPVRLPPPNAETASAMRTICEAVAKAASQLLEIEPGEILAEHRPALDDSGAAGTVVELFLYDTLAGGAGFSPQMARIQSIGKSSRAMILSAKAYSWATRGNRRRFER